MIDAELADSWTEQSGTKCFEQHVGWGWDNVEVVSTNYTQTVIISVNTICYDVSLGDGDDRDG